MAPRASRARIRPRLSVCMIVRDEERLLPRCLASLGGVHDELCVVDTGSRDRTVAVAERHGARVARLDACNGADGKIRDFALARNASIELATGDWILWIDADEVLQPGGAARLRRRLGDDRWAGVRVTMRWDQGQWLSTRLFRRAPGHRFAGRIHEYVVLAGEVTSAPGVVIRNRPDKRGKEGSTDRTIRICEDVLAADPADRRALFYLGNALRAAGRLDEAVARYQAYLELGGTFRCEHHMAAYYLAVCHLLRGAWQATVDIGLRALAIDPRYAETHCVIADALVGLGELDHARHWYRSALAIGAPPPDATLFVDTTAYGAYPRERLRYLVRRAAATG